MGFLGREIEALVLTDPVDFSVQIQFQFALKNNTKFFPDMGIRSLGSTPWLDGRIKGLHPLILNVSDEHLDLGFPSLEIDIDPVLLLQDNIIPFDFGLEEEIHHLNSKGGGNLL